MGISETWAGFQALMEIMKHRESIQARFRKSVHYLREGSKRVYVFGAGGVGKTTLKLTLLSDFDVVKDAIYKDTATVEDEILPNADVWSRIIVAPGQKDRRTNVWPDLFEEIRAGEAAGIIHVTAYGYHSIRRGTSLKGTTHWQRLPEDKRTIDAFMPAYLEDKREEECDVWSDVISVASQAPNHPWLMTLVTKQDLWADREEQVRQFYKNGSYSGAIRDIEQVVGERNVRHEVTFASFIIQNFLGPEDEVLAKTVGGFDQNKQIESVNRLSTLIEELISP